MRRPGVDTAFNLPNDIIPWHAKRTTSCDAYRTEAHSVLMLIVRVVEGRSGRQLGAFLPAEVLARSLVAEFLAGFAQAIALIREHQARWLNQAKG
jgi:hypothetical protein